MRLFTFLFFVWSFEATSSSPGRPQECRNEKHRVQLHYSVPRNWINDPNGMFYHFGEYHLYYQYHPDSNVWGPMHWGHAISYDLVTWTDLPTALYPDEHGKIFSGSCVVDFRNTTGFQERFGEPPVIAIFTHADGDYPQMQSIAVSLNGGRDFTKYAGNPVIPNPGIPDFRDPKVLEYEPGRWVMSLAVADRIRFYGSNDLKSWEFLSDFGRDRGAHGGVWECPDLFPIQLGNQKHWVLLVSINPGGPNGGSVTQYFVGNFDGRNFISNQTETLWMDWGADNYASVSFFNEPKGRVNVIGWMSNWAYANEVPTGIYRGQMTLPRILSLVNVSGQLLLKSELAEEVEKLRNPNEVYQLPARDLPPGFYWNVSKEIGFSKDLQEVNLAFNITGIQGSSSIAICFVNGERQEVCTGYDHEREKNIFLNREASGNLTAVSANFYPRLTAVRHTNDPQLISFKIILDLSAIEVFVDDGVTAMTALFYPDQPLNTLEIRHHAATESSTVSFLGGSVRGLNSIYSCS